jgi:hypothetical protein
MSVIAVLESGERIPTTDTWERAKRLMQEGRYSDDVQRIEQDDEGKEPTNE